MSTEQPDLFGINQAAEARPSPEIYGRDTFIPFIPGVAHEESFTHIENLAGLEVIVKECSKCPLRNSCQQVVFGEGKPDSKIMFIGEGPGKDEDIQGRPFVGRAGQLLNKILQAAEMQRNQVYITNVVKCRPPGNRLPGNEEVRLCRGYLEAQIRLIKPSIIVCLGSLASQVVIDAKARITKIRGKWLTRNGILIMATFHPAALLRNEGYKRPTWEDFKMIRDEYKKVTGMG
ncbi:MAG: uracil-DNA glycosylase [Syntrophomonadaceae bacterium]|jgi:uracil-DNA glycosylase family 4